MSRPRNQQSQSRQSRSGRSRFAANESLLCQFPFADGRRCRMLRLSAHPHYCHFHARAELQEREANRLGAELAQTLSGDFMTATDVNHALGRLYTATAQGRIAPRRAATMAYIGQLILQSVNGIKAEFKFEYSFDQWLNYTRGAKPLSPPTTLAPVSDTQNSSPDSAPSEPSTDTVAKDVLVLKK